MNLPSVSALAVFTLTAASFAADISIEQDLVYGHAEGIELKLDVARPAKGSGPFPTVICIHGGAWMSGNKSGYTPFLRMLAQNGYVAASVDYRLAPRHRYPAQIEDVRLAVRYLRSRAAELRIDPNRVAAVGDSAGGHLALMLGLAKRKGSQVQAVVNLYGPGDIARWLATPEGEKALGRTSDQLLAEVFGTSDRGSRRLREASPLRHVDRKDPPVLTFHGDADQLVNVEQARWLHAALRKAGVPEKLVVLESRGHGFTGADLMSTVRQTLEFLDAWLKTQEARNVGRDASP